MGTMGGKRSRAFCRSLSALYPAAQVTRAAEHGFHRILSTHEIRGREGGMYFVEKKEGWRLLIEKFQQLKRLLILGEIIISWGKMNGIENLVEREW